LKREDSTSGFQADGDRATKETSGSPRRSDAARILIPVMLVIGFLLRIAGNDWGIIHFRASDPPEGVRGTVYTFFPDEREFVACYRALGTSLSRADAKKGSGGLALSPDGIARAAKGLVTGEITFAPEYPTAVSPVSSYLIFFASLPVVGFKRAFGLYESFDSNAVIADAILTGRYLAALFGVAGILAMYRLMRDFGLSGPGLNIGVLMTTLLPIGVAVGHYGNYNTAVSFLELMAFSCVLRALSPDVPADRLVRAGVWSGLALATKLTSGPLLGVLVVAAALRTDRPWRERARVGARATAAMAGVYLLVIAYSVVTQWHDFVRAVNVYLFNIVGGAGPPATREIVAANFLMVVLPFCLSIAGALAGLLSLATLAAGALKDRGRFLLLLWLGAWLGLSLFNPNNQAYRMLTPSLLVVASIAVGIDAFAKRGGALRIAALAIAAVIAVNQAVDAHLIARFFRSRDVRVEADAWVAAHIPEGSSIGNFYEMIYAYHPTTLFTDYFWRRDREYRYVENLDLASGYFPVDYIVTSRAELLKHNFALAANAEAILERAGFRKVYELEPDLALGPYAIPYESARLFSPNLFVSKILVYQRKTALAGRH
jgi:hypothetical protein